jgi:hypothetical protein
MRKKKAPVVIVRKDKRLNKVAHLTAFAVTGGTSAVYTAAKAGSNAAYNARTRKLAAQAEEAEQADGAASTVSTQASWYGTAARTQGTGPCPEAMTAEQEAAMADQTVRGVTIVALERKRDSASGGPRWRVTFDDGLVADTQSHAKIGHEIDNPGYRDTPLDVTLTAARRIRDVRRSDC